MGLRDRAFGEPTGVIGRVGGWIMARTNRRTAAWALDRLDPDPTDRLLEVGFGPGVGVEIATERLPGGLVVGVDPSTAMAVQARDRNRPSVTAGRAALGLGVAEALPFPDDSFDKALAVNTLPLWEDPAAGLRELQRVLAPKGTIAIAFTPRFEDSAAGVPDQLTRAGFHRARRLAGDHGACVLAERGPTPQAPA